MRSSLGLGADLSCVLYSDSSAWVRACGEVLLYSHSLLLYSHARAPLVKGLRYGLRGVRVLVSEKDEEVPLARSARHPCEVRSR